MLSEKRIKEAERNVNSYLKEGLLRKSAPDKIIVDLFIKNARESLKVADEIYQKNFSGLWVIVCSYYSMYYYANAVLLKLGYKVGDKIVHKVTSDALVVFVRNKLKEALLEEYEKTKDEALSIAGMKADEVIESFDFERNKRGLIQYKTLESEKNSKAQTSLNRAKEFLTLMEEILQK